MKRPLLLTVDDCSTPDDLRDLAAKALSSGFDGVEWRLPVEFAPGQLANSNLGTIPIGAMATRCEMMDIPSAVHFVTSKLQEAASFAAKVLNLSIPPVRQGDDGHGFARYQDSLNFAYELLHQVRLEAEATGVSIALEAASGGGLLSPIELRELIDAVYSSAVGACIDVERIAMIGSPFDWIQTLQRRVQSVRYCDISRSVGEVAPASHVGKETLVPLLDEIDSDCPLILCDHSGKLKFAPMRCDG